MTAPSFYLTPEAEARRRSRLIQAVAANGLRTTGLNSEGFECAETLPASLMAQVEAARAEMARAA
jgi:hypothetical protein